MRSSHVQILPISAEGKFAHKSAVTYHILSYNDKWDPGQFWLYSGSLGRTPDRSDSTST